MSTEDVTHQLEFSDNHLLSELVGPEDRHILRVEQCLGVRIALRGNRVAIAGDETGVVHAKTALQHLYHKLEVIFFQMGFHLEFL